jgi:cell division protein FtsL
MNAELWKFRFRKGVTELQTATKQGMTDAEERRSQFKVYETEAESEEMQQPRRKRKLHHNSKVEMLVCVILIFMMSMGYMLLNTQVTYIGYEINKQMAAIDELSNDNARLLLEIEQATSPEKVAAYAEEHFNMVAASDDNIIYYSESDTGDSVIRMADSGMSVDPVALGSGSVEIVESGTENKLIEAFGALWESIKGGVGSTGVQLGMLGE